MTNHDLQKPLQALSPVLDHIVAKSVREDLARERRNRDAGGFALEHVAEVLEVGVASPDGRLLEFEGGNVGDHVDFVVGVHVSSCAVGAGVSDLIQV